MGCDIHAFIEYTSSGDLDVDYVDCFCELELDRSYDMFSKLANVRGFYKESSDPKGLPSNISYNVKCKVDEWEDAHSKSYLTYKEYKQLIKECEDTMEFVPIQYIVILKTMKALSKFYCDVRLVFWFDS